MLLYLGLGVGGGEFVLFCLGVGSFVLIRFSSKWYGFKNIILITRTVLVHSSSCPCYNYCTHMLFPSLRGIPRRATPSVFDVT